MIWDCILSIFTTLKKKCNFYLTALPNKFWPWLLRLQVQRMCHFQIHLHLYGQWVVVVALEGAVIVYRLNSIDMYTYSWLCKPLIFLHFENQLVNQYGLKKIKSCERLELSKCLITCELQCTTKLLPSPSLICYVAMEWIKKDDTVCGMKLYPWIYAMFASQLN